MSRKSAQQKHRRNAAATRAAILDSARRAFAKAGYDGAGVREIAAGAGVTAMLVNRYFVSKEKLFAEVLAATAASPTILTAENLAAPDLAERIAATLVDITDSKQTPLDGFLIMLHSASSKRAAEIGRRRVAQTQQKNLSEALKGDLAPERAGLILSLVAGVQVMRQMMALPALAKADPKKLAELLAPLFRQLVTRGAREPQKSARVREALREVNGDTC